MEKDLHNLFSFEKNMKDHMMLFGVTLAKRYTNRQKRIFTSQAEPFFRKLGYGFSFQDSSKKLSRVVNIIIGDIAKANTIVLCPYDTPSKSILPYCYFPFNSSDNLKQENREIFLRSLSYIGSCYLTYWIISRFSDLPLLQRILGGFILAFLIIFCYRLIVGIPNPVNFNRNSTSLALVAALAERTRNKSEIAYVLLDRNTESNAGLRTLASEAGMRNKFFIYLDCLAEGEELVCAHSPALKLNAERLIAALPGLNVIDHVFSEEERLKETNLQIFPNMLHLCSGTIRNRKFVVRNTRSKKDFKVDIPRLEKIRDGLINYLKG